MPVGSSAAFIELDVAPTRRFLVPRRHTTTWDRLPRAARTEPLAVDASKTASSSRNAGSRRPESPWPYCAMDIGWSTKDGGDGSSSSM